VKFAIEFNIPPPKTLSNKALDTSKQIVTKWITESAIPRKRKQRSA
jgi:hypothetical protein